MHLTLMIFPLLFTATAQHPIYSDIDKYFSDENMKAVGGKAIKLTRTGFDDEVKLSYVDVINPTNISLCINHHQFLKIFYSLDGSDKKRQSEHVIFPFGLLNKQSKWSNWIGPIGSYVENYDYLEIAPGQSAQVYLEEDVYNLSAGFEMNPGETYDVVSFLYAVDCSIVRGMADMYSSGAIFFGIEDMIADRVTSIPNAAVGTFDYSGGIFYWHVHSVTAPIE